MKTDHKYNYIFVILIAELKCCSKVERRLQHECDESMRAEGDEIVSPRACNQAAGIVIGITVSSGTRILK